MNTPKILSSQNTVNFVTSPVHILMIVWFFVMYFILYIILKYVAFVPRHASLLFDFVIATFTLTFLLVSYFFVSEEDKWTLAEKYFHSLLRFFDQPASLFFITILLVFNYMFVHLMSAVMERSMVIACIEFVLWFLFLVLIFVNFFKFFLAIDITATATAMQSPSTQPLATTQPTLRITKAPFSIQSHFQAFQNSTIVNTFRQYFSASPTQSPSSLSPTTTPQPKTTTTTSNLNQPTTTTSKPTTTQPLGTFASTTTQPLGIAPTTTQPLGIAPTTTQPLGIASTTTQPSGTFASTTTQPLGTFASTTTHPPETFSPTTTQPLGIVSTTTQHSGTFASTTTQPLGTFAPTTTQHSGIASTTTSLGIVSTTTQPLEQTATFAGTASTTIESDDFRAYNDVLKKQEQVEYISETIPTYSNVNFPTDGYMAYNTSGNNDEFLSYNECPRV